MKARLQEAEALFAAHKVDEAMNVLGDLIEAVERDAPARDQLLDWVVAHVDDAHPQVGAHIALAGGALVENGAPTGAIGRAIVAPIERALGEAVRMIGYARQFGHQHGEEEGGDDEDSADHDDAAVDDAAVEDSAVDDSAVDDDAHDHEDADHDHGGGHEHGHDHEGDHDHDHDHDSHSLEIAGWALSEADLANIAERDVAAVRAWFSLEMWYRPAVATWSRDRAVLREVQARPPLRAAIEQLGSETATSHWLSVLLEAVTLAPFIVLVPELDEAWSFTADGVVDMGQLTVLLSKSLASPLARIGGSGPATDEQIAVMSGEGPQSGDSGYSSSFAFYPIEATDPTDGLPRDGIHLWSAPGGTGTHSLPGDFLPGTIAPIDGVRLLVMVGPKAPGMRFVRIIQSARMFEALAARITDVRSLPAEQAKPLFELARARGKQARATS